VSREILGARLTRDHDRPPRRGDRVAAPPRSGVGRGQDVEHAGGPPVGRVLGVLGLLGQPHRTRRITAAGS